MPGRVARCGTVEESQAREPTKKARRTKKRKRREDKATEALPPPDASSARTIRRLVIVSGAAAVLGIALVGTHESVIGAVLVIGGMLTLIGSIHKLGRLGVDGSARLTPGTNPEE